MDGLQVGPWSKEAFAQMRGGKVSAVRVGLPADLDFAGVVQELGDWHRRFQRYGDLIAQTGEEGLTAIQFAALGPAGLERDAHVIPMLRQLGVTSVRFSTGVQTRLAGGLHEDEDPGLSRLGESVLAACARAGLIVDLTGMGPRSMDHCLDLGETPMVLSGPVEWLNQRGEMADRLKRLASTGGLVGISGTLEDLPEGRQTTLKTFCRQVVELTKRVGADNVMLCTGMGGTAPRVDWLRTNLDFEGLSRGLLTAGMNAKTMDNLLGMNARRVFLDQEAKGSVS